VLSVAHGYGMVPLHQLQTHSTAQIKLFSFHWILKLVGSTVESARYLLNSKIWRAKDIINPFDSYVKPPNTAIWNPKATEIHGLHQFHDKIVNADSIEVVWPKFVLAVEAAIGDDGKQGMIVAWNGKSCDMEWIYRITQDKNNHGMQFPNNCHFFMDPYAILTNYKGCSQQE
jgi:hypothetical protein